MRLNPLPFLFLPGAALGGWLWGGARGLAWALAAWAAGVSIGTAAAWLLHHYRRR